MTRIMLALDVFDSGDNAPEGWVEIQRHDSGDDPSLAPVETDDEAAAAVAAFAGMAGCAARYSPDLGVLALLDAEGNTGALSPAYEALDAMAKEAGGCPRWIAIVPVVAARAAGLL